jgi:hypothetical protein
MKFIQLDRKFRRLTKVEVADVELLVRLSIQGFGDSQTWEEILKHPRVVLLAEARSGKTTEMEEKARLLREGRIPAFFLPLEDFDASSGIEDILPADQVQLWGEWKQGQGTAWLFLDAVDELKLNGKKLRRAFSRIASDTAGHLERLHVIVSCRPTDWQPISDSEVFQRLLPIPKPTISHATAEEEFLSAFRRPSSAATTNLFVEEPGPETIEGVLHVALLPLDNRQIEKFSSARGVRNVASFMAEIEKQDAWIFARRPGDLESLLLRWERGLGLGSLSELHEQSVIAGLNDNPDRDDQGILPDSKIREGAERLALALTLTRTQAIRSPEAEPDPGFSGGVLDSAEVLPDWSESERKVLLRRPIVDPATYGRVKFHHRSVREYLAARRLREMLARGMPIKKLLRLLFAQQYEVKVVRPSMRAVAAWLALENGYVQKELLEREPETLLSHGDPGSLPQEVKVKALRALVAAYGSGGRVGLAIPVEQISRFASPDLGEVIRELWSGGPVNGDVQELLFDLIEAGALPNCSGICEAAALDVNFSEDLRIKAIQILAAFGHEASLRRINESILNEASKWQLPLVASVVPWLFPKLLTPASLISLIEKVVSDQDQSRFRYGLHRIANQLDISNSDFVDLRSRLRDLVLSVAEAKNGGPTWLSVFDFVIPALATLCVREIGPSRLGPGDGWAEACAAVNFTCGDRHDQAVNELSEKIRASAPGLRTSVLDAEIRLLQLRLPSASVRTLFQILKWDGALGEPQESDRLWLEPIATAGDETAITLREVAVYCLFELWGKRGSLEDEAVRLQEMLSSDSEFADLAKAFIENAAPGEAPAAVQAPSDTSTPLAEEFRDWRNWREQILREPSESFKPANLDSTLLNLYRWLALHESSEPYRDGWGRVAITRAFSAEIADLTSVALRQFWRKAVPEIWSGKTPASRSFVSYTTLLALQGLAAESENLDWARRLTAEEARLAASLSTHGLNGLPSWTKELAMERGEVVEAVLGEEIEAQLRLAGSESHLPLLQNLGVSDGALKALMAPRLFKCLENWLLDFEGERSTQFSARNLNIALGIVFEGVPEHGCRLAAELCSRRFEDEPESPLAIGWLRGLFSYSPDSAVVLLNKVLVTIEEKDKRPEVAVKALAGLFGRAGGSFRERGDKALTPSALEALIRLSYEYVKPEGDRQYDGVYTPGDRDEAQRARSYFVESLMNTPGLESYRILLDLSRSTLAHMADYIRLRARGRAAEDSELTPFATSEVVHFDQQFEFSPQSRDELFDVMVDRLEDLNHEILNHDFTDKATLKAIALETEMQRTLALRIEKAARGAYTVTRESEVANANEPDIRLCSVRGDQKATIEVKIADNWTIRELEEALEIQLVGKYLRHDTCRAGCLLLTFHGSKRWIPAAGVQMRFDEVVEFLKTRAREIEAAHNHDVRLAVIGFDLTDP